VGGGVWRWIEGCGCVWCVVVVGVFGAWRCVNSHRGMWGGEIVCREVGGMCEGMVWKDEVCIGRT